MTEERGTPEENELTEEFGEVVEAIERESLTEEKIAAEKEAIEEAVDLVLHS